MSEVERVSAANQVHPLQAVQQYSQFSTLDFPQPVKGFLLWSPPKQRQRWGEDTTLPHINWGDLFFDLFYVSAALNLSNVLFYINKGESFSEFIYFVGMGGAILLEWFQRTFFDARFSWDGDPWHKLIEVVHLCFLAWAVVHIRPVATMSDPTEPDMFDFALGTSLLAAVNIYRSIEIIFKVVGEEAAKVGEKKFLIQFIVQATFYLSATVTAGIAYFGSRDADNYGKRDVRSLESLANTCTRMLSDLVSERELTAEVKVTETNHIPIILCSVGWVSGVVALLIRVCFFEESGGGHKKSNVPMNIEYIIHRFGELTMLLLGESILSILITPTSDSLEYHVIFFAGIISIIVVQYSHYKYQPHSSNEHAFRRSLRAGVVFYVIMIIYCFALIALGTAYKMFLYEYSYAESKKNNKIRHLVTLMSRNLAEVDTDFGTISRKQRVADLFCVSITVVWVCLEGMWIAHNGTKKYFSFLKTKQGVFVGFLRAGLIILMATISQYTINLEGIALIGLVLLLAEVLVNVCADYFWTKKFGEPDDEDHWPNVTEPATTEQDEQA